MAFANPSVADFKAYFDRDFPYGTDIETEVRDQDIAKGFQQANMNVSQRFFSDQSGYNIGYLLLSAHFMVMNLRSSSQGLNGQFSFLEQSKNVGAVSQSFAIPQRILDNAFFSMLMKTNYGAMYMQLILPQLVGNAFVVYGTTLP
jgi:hypothetical protein